MTPEQAAEELTRGEMSTTAIGLWLKWKLRCSAGPLMETVVKWLLKEARGKEFYEYRCVAVQAWAKTLPEPYQEQCYNILANGKPEP